jgi:hypothetical protein
MKEYFDRVPLMLACVLAIVAAVASHPDFRQAIASAQTLVSIQQFAAEPDPSGGATSDFSFQN